MTQMLQNYQIGLNFMSGIALFVGAFLIYNAFAMTVVERTREFGMLRTIGMTRGQVDGADPARGRRARHLWVGWRAWALGMLLARGLTRLDGSHPQPATHLRGSARGRHGLQLGDGAGRHVSGGGHPCLAGGAHLTDGSAARARQIKRRLAHPPGLETRRGALLVVSAILLITNPFPYDVQFRLGSMTVFGLFSGATLLIPAPSPPGSASPARS
ncbi:MAG: ABC transporter permease [Marinilabiliales bacterium]|nr:ABC transporter permease [Marinilabiliales bacterium]